MTRYYFIRNSGNSKTGNIPVTYTEKESCPSTCMHYKTTCFAGLGHTNIGWEKTSLPKVYKNNNASGLTIAELVNYIRTIKIGSTFRHNIGGDLPGKGNHLNKAELKAIIHACENRSLKGFCYTHKKTPSQIALYQKIRSSNFVINLSADSIKEVDNLWNTGLPLVVTLPSDAPNVTVTPNGHKIVACPAEKFNVTCGGSKDTRACGGEGGPLCTRADRTYAIGFRAHASRVRQLDAKLKAEIIGE